MVQIRENLTRVEGTVVGRAPHPRLADHDEVRVAVADAGPATDDKPDLLAPRPGDELPIAIRRELLGDASVGARIRLRASRTSSGEIMAEPHPEPRDFSAA